MTDTARWNGSNWVTLATLERWTGSAWTTIANGYRWTGSAWQSILAVFSASISPSGANGTITSGGTCTSNSVTCTVIGGIGPFTYNWTCTNNVINITNASSATTTFSHLFSGIPPQAQNGTATCTVTDTANSQQVFPTCSVSLNFA